MIRLIDRNAQGTVTISGTLVTFRQLEGTEKSLIGMNYERAFGKVRPDGTREEPVLSGTERILAVNCIRDVVARAVVSIEGMKPPYFDHVLNFENGQDLWALINAAVEFSKLKEAEAKNWVCSPDGSGDQPSSDQGATTAGPTA